MPPLSDACAPDNLVPGASLGSGGGAEAALAAALHQAFHHLGLWGSMGCGLVVRDLRANDHGSVSSGHSQKQQ